MINFGSLFAGVGGFDLGFEQAGMRCSWQVEIDKACQSVLKKHWNEVELFDDVRTVGKHNLEPVDVICGGFPCQDVSVAGKRAGLAGERSGLWNEFARIIDELEPRWVVVENVPGLLSSHGGRDFATIIQWMAKRGYGVAWRVLDSQYFGVPQRRRRVFIVGSFGDISSAEVLFESEGATWNTSQGRGKRRASPEPVENSTGVGAHKAYTISQQDDGRNGGVGGMSISETTLSVGISSKSQTLIVQDGIVGVRKLTPTETERLQGFPDGWTNIEQISDSKRYKQMGNAVSVPVSKWIAKRILLVDGRKHL